jgi:hypothetical protein
LRILNLRFPQHILAEIPAQILSGAQIDLSPKDHGELPFHARDTEKPWHVRGLEIHKHINVTLGVKILSQNRSEQRQAPDVVLLAELGKVVFVYRDSGHAATSKAFKLSMPRWMSSSLSANLIERA